MTRLLQWKTPVPMTVALALTMAFAPTQFTPLANAGIGGNAYRITATSAAGQATYAIPAPVGEPHYWEWRTTTTIEMRDSSSGNLIATLNPTGGGCGIQFVEDPVIGLSFSVQAGVSPTTFSIASGVLSFPAIPAPEGRASAAYTVTDFNGDGATLVPFSAPQSYHAVYNGPTPFADLIGPFGAGAFSSNTLSDALPAGPGFLPIGVAVSDMQVLLDFTLSPRDLASGTSVYVMQSRPVPVEPVTWSRIKSLIG